MAKDISTIADDFNNDVDKYIDTLDPQTEKAVNDGVRSVSDYVAQLGDVIPTVGELAIGVTGALATSGMYKGLAKILNDSFSKTINTSSDLYNAIYDKRFEFSNEGLLRIDRLKQSSMFSIKAQGDAFASKVVQGISAGSTDKRLIIKQIEEQFGKQMSNHAKTLINTGTSASYNEANVALAKEAGITKFQYVGNIISDTRKFCIKHLNQIKTTNKWDELDNGQINPVSVYLGGYNCRHSLVGVA